MYSQKWHGIFFVPSPLRGEGEDEGDKREFNVFSGSSSSSGLRPPSPQGEGTKCKLLYELDHSLGNLPSIGIVTPRSRPSGSNPSWRRSNRCDQTARSRRRTVSRQRLRFWQWFPARFPHPPTTKSPRKPAF